MKRYDQLSFKKRMLVLLTFTAMLIALVIYNENNTFLNFMRGFTGGMLIAFMFVEMIFFLKKRRGTE